MRMTRLNLELNYQEDIAKQVSCYSMLSLNRNWNWNWNNYLFDYDLNQATNLPLSGITQKHFCELLEERSTNKSVNISDHFFNCAFGFEVTQKMCSLSGVTQ